MLIPYVASIAADQLVPSLRLVRGYISAIESCKISYVVWSPYPESQVAPEQTARRGRLELH
ncbi:hypothetical protein DPMN_062628 [Dreissena polymorpha]|uniref:Uncharacterized protein n=1 Tax=Dreissena polymorpha TaxID=45954 RepID=A0A9D4C925_DREPO|nr:hypothetical protein DPMN_062628 [Dreissena polymorpha]